MVSERDRSHVLVPVDQFRTTEGYSHHGGGGSKPVLPMPPGGRAEHARQLTQQIESAQSEVEVQRATSAITVSDANPGVYLQFESFKGLDLVIRSLENRRGRIEGHVEVVAVPRRPPAQPEDSQSATVFVPKGRLPKFLKELKSYAKETPKEAGEKRHENAYDRISKIRLAAVRALWTDGPDLYPATGQTSLWWEVWLRRTDGNELARLLDFATQTGLTIGDRRIQFDDRIVTLVFGTANQLAPALSVFGDIAELRKAKETAAFFTKESNVDQAAWIDELAKRTTLPASDAPTVCVLDTGVNGGHRLLEGALPPEDSHTVNPAWGKHDHDGHGTQMAGLALYGDLVPQLEATGDLILEHRLESVKILPPNSANQPELYAAITAEATERPEVQAVGRRRVYSLAVTTEDGRDRGQPTSWSAAVDALAAGRGFDPTDQGLKYFDDDDVHQRLYVVSAGNVTELEREHLSRSDVEPVHDPAHAWNALTVGAYTDKVMINDPEWSAWSPVADQGELSPWSTTSVTFQSKWPVKPEVVFEGGNAVHDIGGNVDGSCDDLLLLTTHHLPATKPLTSSEATSAATAQVARHCAIIAARYPTLWPETIRALVVHSARWTDAMQARFDAATNKTQRQKLLQRYGYGVPSLEIALRSASNAVTLIAQDSIKPFGDGKMREIHFHGLPWPQEILQSLGSASVRVRVTLSYFVEPNPGRRGWKDRHRYQSHGLRFRMKSATETVDELRKYLNKAALDEQEKRPSSSDATADWYLGPDARNGGSIHSDVLEGTAAEIADRGYIAVYPVTGWWKELKKRDRSEFGARYALIVSIETDEVDADVWTPVVATVETETAVALKT